MNSLKEFLGLSKRKEYEENYLDIGFPTNVVQNVKTIKNPKTGELEGLPDEWYDLLKSQISEQEQSANPSAGE